MCVCVCVCRTLLILERAKTEKRSFDRGGGGVGGGGGGGGGDQEFKEVVGKVKMKIHLAHDILPVIISYMPMIKTQNRGACNTCTYTSQRCARIRTTDI